jgi:hypothetical protein
MTKCVSKTEQDESCEKGTVTKFRVTKSQLTETPLTGLKLGIKMSKTLQVKQVEQIPIFWFQSLGFHHKGFSHCVVKMSWISH